MWAALKRANASVYYVSGAGMIAGLVALFCRRYGRKMVLRIASLLDCNPETLCIRYSRDRKLYAYGLKHADIVLAQTADQQRALAEHFGRESIVAPSVSDTIAQRVPFAQRDIDVLWVGNLRGLKQPELLLQLARALPHLQFEMAGGSYPGDEALFEAMKHEAASISNLKFHGAVPFHDMKSLFERARLLVATSRVEGFPNTYLQASGARHACRGVPRPGQHPVRARARPCRVRHERDARGRYRSAQRPGPMAGNKRALPRVFRPPYRRERYARAVLAGDSPPLRWPSREPVMALATAVKRLGLADAFIRRNPVLYGRAARSIRELENRADPTTLRRVEERLAETLRAAGVLRMA